MDTAFKHKRRFYPVRDAHTKVPANQTVLKLIRKALKEKDQVDTLAPISAADGIGVPLLINVGEAVARGLAPSIADDGAPAVLETEPTRWA